jgi:hypothetical protein
MSKFDLILEESLQERKQRREDIAAMQRKPVSLHAKCPTEGCHGIDGYLTLEELRLGYCAAHKLMWKAGYCTIHDEPEQRARWAEVGADNFEMATGWLPGMRANVD